MVVPTIKCVVVGDNGVGKTSLIASYATGNFPKEPIKEQFSKYNTTVMIGDEPYTLYIHDTEGGDDYDRLRPLSYPDSDIILICYSCVNPDSFENVMEKWYPEVRHHRPTTPVLLVGTQFDLVDDEKIKEELKKKRQRCINIEDGEKMGKQLGIKSLHMSTLTQFKLKDVFDEAIVASLEPPRPGEKRKQGNCIIA